MRLCKKELFGWCTILKDDLVPKIIFRPSLPGISLAALERRGGPFLVTFQTY